MKKKTAARLAFIAPLLLIFCVGTWVGVNMLVARRLNLYWLASDGDVYWVAYVIRWDPKQVDGEPDPPISTMTAEDPMVNVPRIDRVGGLDKPLLIAAYNGHPEVVQTLLRAGADPYTSNLYRRNALNLASMQGHHDVVEVLVHTGMDVNRPDGFSRTSLDYAESAEVRSILLGSGATAPSMNEGKVPGTKRHRHNDRSDDP